MKYLNQRKSRRIDAKIAVALVKNGICQVINLNKEGVSFRCFVDQEFPDEWSMSIYDAKGLNLEELKVKKIWEKRARGQRTAVKPEIAVGGKFENLSVAQEKQLYSYLLQIVEIERDV